MPNNILDVLRNNQTAYGAWGNQAALAKSQGWYPETTYGDVTVYRSPHDHAFNDVVNNEHIALLGHSNQKFDVVIRDKNNNIVKTIMQGISPSDVQQYITNSRSTVAQRNMSILKNTTPIDIAAK